MQSFGIAALIIGVIGIFVPVVGYILCGLSGMLAFFSAGRGTALGISASIINIINLFVLSPTLLIPIASSMKNRQSNLQLSDQEGLFFVLLLIKISAIFFLASARLLYPMRDEQESSLLSISKKMLGAILFTVTILLMATAGKTIFYLKAKGSYHSLFVKSRKDTAVHKNYNRGNASKDIAKITTGYATESSEIASHIRSGKPFVFDIWQAGMEEVDLLKTARGNGIHLYDGGDSYKYGTKLLEENANVKLYLTAKTKRLMQLSIDWNDGRKIKGTVLDMITKQHAMQSGNIYKINGRTEIELRSFVGVDLQMTYRDLLLMQENEVERQVKMDEDQQHAIMKDGSKFFDGGTKEAEPEQEPQTAAEQQVYKITDKNGVVRYTNTPSENASPVELKPLEQVPLKEIIGYRVHTKSAKPMPCKEVRRGKPGMLVMVDGPITIEIPLDEVTAIEEQSQVGEKISIRMLRPDAF